MNLQTIFHDATLNIIQFGTRYDYEDKRLQENVWLIAENVKIINGARGIVGYHIIVSVIGVFIVYIIFFQ